MSCQVAVPGVGVTASDIRVVRSTPAGWRLNVRMSDRAEVVRYWRSVELFSPQDIPSADREQVYDLDDDSLLPWEAQHSLSRMSLGAGERWRHTIYCGVFELEAAFELLREQFPKDPESFDARPAKGDGALAAFVVSDEGRQIPGGEVLSNCAWAIGRAVDPGPKDAGWLSGLEDADDAFTEMFEDLGGVPDEDEQAAEQGAETRALGRPLAIEDLFEFTRGLIELLGAERLAASGVRVHSRRVKAADAERADDHDFLNSFVAADLEMVASEVASGNCGRALRRYITFGDEIDHEARVDVEQRLDTVYASVAPGSVPLGRWPAKADQPLALSQQLAVASVMESLGDGVGMFAVNGPPGTGKTTMLREIVAEVVVARARQLAELADPKDAFVDKHRWTTGGYRRVVHELRKELTGFEMVVACATNAAAENISVEIPGIGAIDADRCSEIDYYPQLASRLLRATRQDRSSAETAAWALVAGRLGNKSNRAAFVDALWYTDKRGKAATSTRDQHPPPGPGPAGEQLGLVDVLKSYEDAAPGPSWPDAVRAFRSALTAAAVLGDERGRIFDLLRDASAVEQDADRCRQRAAAAPAEHAKAQRRVAEQEQIAVARRDECLRHEQARRDHRDFRPSFTESLFSAGRAMREWRTADGELAAEVRSSQAEAAAAETLVAELEVVAAAAARAIHEHVAAAAAATQRVEELHAELADAAESLGPAFPGERWWHDRDFRERNAPWIDEAWNAARTDLFLAALRLHKAFAVHAATQMRQSLWGAIDILSGAAPAGICVKAAMAAWQSMFLMVPVLSTSFASFARVFSHLGRESLGWLFIDEAGQCTPQTAAGAIWRSQRVLVVGDPLQLEPVVTLPFTVQQAIRDAHGVDETWLPSRCSAQILADRVSRLGTFRGRGEDAIWVGAPLIVHRRCDEPIFTIVNEIAYDGQMINATPRRTDLDLPASKWLDVVSSHCDQHWIPAEGEKLNAILEKLDRQSLDFREVFVLTPFRQVADHRGLAVHRRRYPGITLGTVHTAQGREADIVILILGGNPDRPGAKRWASQTPNLLNVAVSRAKRRIYVIGDRRKWSAHPYFDVLDGHLPAD